jgi:signal transduction histidine kinase
MNRIDPDAGEASFSHDENNIQFSLAVPSFIDEKQIRFSYMLGGSSNKSWSEPSSRSVIDFVNLAPGKYTLQVKAGFLNGRYAGSDCSYSFIIRPAWWQTPGFRIVWISLLMVLSGLLIRNYYGRKFHQQKILLDKQQAVEKERARIATDMHDDLGAGLSTIRFLSEKVKQHTASLQTKADLEKIQSASNGLIDKMNEIIWSMNESNNSLENLVFYTRSYSMEYCDENNLQCHIRLPENIPPVSVSGETRRNIFLTVKEILHNIVKHAAARNVDIVFETTGSLSILIRDDGVGFRENHKTPGGNGFRNMRKRMELMGGSLQIQNGSGITILLKVPMEGV